MLPEGLRRCAGPVSMLLSPTELSRPSLACSEVIAQVGVNQQNLQSWWQSEAIARR